MFQKKGVSSCGRLISLATLLALVSLAAYVNGQIEPVAPDPVEMWDANLTVPMVPAKSDSMKLVGTNLQLGCFTDAFPLNCGVGCCPRCANGRTDVCCPDTLSCSCSGQCSGGDDYDYGYGYDYDYDYGGGFCGLGMLPVLPLMLLGLCASASTRAVRSPRR